MSKKKQEALKESKPYDGILKALFGEQAEEIVSSLLPEAHRPEGLADTELNVELNRTTLSIDIGRHILYKGDSVTFNLEAQSGPDDDLLPRMNEYSLNLFRKYKRPVVSMALLLFECAIPEAPFKVVCGGDVFSEFYPIIICMWQIDPYKVVDRHQRCLYPLLPTMERPSVDLLTQALQEMNEYDTRPQFTRHLTWFQTMLRRTTTLSQEDKHKIEEVLHMEYQGYTLLKEDPVIHSLISEGELKGKIEGKIEGEIKGEIKGLREAILDIADDLFSLPVVVHIQQAIVASQDTEQLRKFLRQLVRLSDEQEVLALLAHYFPVPGEIKGMQEMILDIVSDRFSPQVVAQVQQTIAPRQDAQLLKRFHRQLVQLSDEQEVLALLTQCFPTS
ncbi:MAG TPA: hypothetical protein VHV10_03015 [Ktedonobacteraceae bacterium]|jgi:hypothetical protein|nr:hypothetical protein [Ktedonobacteraceae bacterium]